MKRLCLVVLPMALMVVLVACDNAGSTQDAWSSGSNDGIAPVYDLDDCEPADSDVADADAEELFNAPQVPAFDFYMPRAEWETLQQNARDEEYVAAQACFEGRRLGRVGLRFKGAHGSIPTQLLRRAW